MGYLSELIHVHQPSKALSSANQVILDVPRTKLNNRGDRAFAVAARVLWNSSPLNVRTARTIENLNSLLKPHLFSLVFS